MKTRLMDEAMRAARHGRRMDASVFPAADGGWTLFSGQRTLTARRTRWWLLLALVLAGMLLIPARASAAPTAGGNCIEDFDHHNPTASPYFARLTTAGKIWVQASTGSIVAAVMISECGRYLIGIWRNGVFTTHFLTSWGYVLAQATGFLRSSWSKVLIRSAWLILVPCPGTWLGHPNAWTRPCPAGGTS